MKTETFSIELRKSVAIKLFLILALIAGGGNLAFAQKSLPYEYGFNTTDISVDGWTMTDCKTTATATGPYNGSYPSARSASYSFRFFYYSSAQYIISPELSTSSTGLEVSFFYNLNSTSGNSQSRTFSIAYSTTDTELTSFSDFEEFTVTGNDAIWHQWTTSIDNMAVKFIAIKYNNNSSTFFIDDFSVEAQELYKSPSNLTVSSVTASSATLTWTNGRDETAWQIAYSTKEDFNPDTEGTKVSVTENPYTLTGLTDNVTYYAYVRSYYDGNYSAWSNKVEVNPKVYLLLNNGANESTYAPIHNYTNYGTVSQYVIPSSELISIQNRLITRLTFYTKESTVNWTGATFDVYLDEPLTTTYASTGVSLKDWGTKVVSAKVLSVNEGKLQIELDTPFSYSIGNLLIGIQEIGSTSSSVTSTWLGVKETTNYTSAYTYKYSSTGTQYTGSAQFSPKLTIESVSSSLPVTLGTNGYTTFACPRPLDLANLPSGLKAYKATVDGSTVKFTEINQAVPANTGMLLEGEAGETYDIPVAESGTAPDGNEFLVNSVGGTFPADADYTYYGLIKNTLTFGTFEPGSVAIPTNKAYLKVADEGGEARQLTCVFEDGSGTTAIRTVGVQTNRNGGQYYDLQGRRVANPTKGVYIVDGKKLIVK